MPHITTHTVRLAVLTTVAVFVLANTLPLPAGAMQSRVTEAVLKAEPVRSGPCPVTVTFNGYITSDGPGTVKYTFGRSDGATGPVHTLEFKTAGTQAVTTTWTLGGPDTVFEGWQIIKVLSPNAVESKPEAGAFTLRCGQTGETSSPKSSGDLLTVIEKDKDFQLFVRAVKAARLQGLLKNKTVSTLFVPSDMAFAKLSKEHLNVLINNTDVFKDFLLRHVVPGRVTTPELGSGKIPSLTSIAGSVLTITVNQKRVVVDNSSIIVRPDMVASNGIVHGLDGLLTSSFGPIEVPRSKFGAKYQGRQERSREMLARYHDREGRVRPDLLERGIAAARRLPIATVRSASVAHAADKSDSRGRFVKAGYSTQVEAIWQPIGPQPLIEKETGRIDSGEATSIAIDPRGRRTQVIYLGTHAGGVWKTTDGGLTWLPKTDRMPSLSIGAVALDPANPEIVYAGTGSPFDGVGLYFSKSRGLYKSLDGGETWGIMGRDIFGPRPAMPGIAANPGARMYQIALPSTNVLLLATDQGLYRSIDGGENFGANSPDFNDRQPLLNGVFAGVAVDTTNPRIVYASQFGVGILRSTDGGVTFPENLFLNPDGTQKPNTPVSGQYQHLSFSQSTLPNNQTLYASVNFDEFTYLNLFKSTDGGATWTTPSTNATSVSRCSDCFFGQYAHVVAVDPRSADRVFLAFANIHFSTNGGVTFGAASPHAEIHPDHRAIVFSPLSHIDNGQTNPSQTDVFVGNDGGIYSGSSRRLSYWQSLNATIATTLIMQIDMGNNDLGKPVYAGLWDHGATSNYVTDSFIMRRYPLAWIKYVNGDGGSAVADPDDPTSSYQVGNFGLVWTTDGGRTVTPLPAGIADNPNNIGIAGTRSHPGSEGSTVTTAGHLYTAYGRRLMQDTERLFEFPIKVSDIQASRPPRLWVTLWEDRNPMGGSVWSRAGRQDGAFHKSRGAG